MPKSVALVVLAQRLKQARQAIGFSQVELGIRMGLPEEVASTRINRYEKGVHAPNLETAERMAKELGVSLSWLVCTDPKLADVIDGFTKLDATAQDAVVAQVKAALRKTKAARTAPRPNSAAAKPKGRAPAKAPKPKAKPRAKAKPKTVSKSAAKRAKPKAPKKK